MARPKVYSTELRDRLVDATATTIAIHGADALSLRSLAAHVGTSTNAVYALFGSRDDLIQAVVDEAARSLRRAQREAAGEGRSLADLEALAWAYYEWARNNPGMYEVMYGTAEPGGLPALADDACHHPAAPLVDVVTRLMDAGVLRREPVQVVVTSVHATMHGLASLDAAAGAASTDLTTARTCLRSAVLAWRA